MASCVRVRAPSQAALSYALMTVVWDVGAGMCVCACAVELAGPERGRVVQGCYLGVGSGRAPAECRQADRGVGM